ncbi:polyketide synthase dehydratase domain-containing protein, partial [Prauserella halophila]
HPFYGSVLFHEGRFRRVQHYDLLTAFRVEAWITAEDGQEWFSPLHSSDLLFGDPGAHDASLHVLLACVPHRLALPVGAGRFTVWRRPDGPLQVVATEIAHTGDTYDFTVDVREPDGSAVARWDGLQLRAVEPRRLPSRLPVPLVGPWLSRRLTEIGIAADVEVTACSGDRAAGSAAEVASLLCGVPVGHDLRGALMTTTDRNGDEAHVCGSYTGDFVLVGRCSHAVGVDWQRSDPAVPMQGTELEPGDRASAAALRAAAGETEAESVLRMWSVREALVKLGHSQDLALDVRTVTDDGIVVADVGPVEIVSVRLAVGELGDTTIALAVTAKG